MSDSPKQLHPSDEKAPQDQDTSRKQRPPQPRPPVARWQYFFWLLVILLPILGYKMLVRDNERPRELTQKQFEMLLERGAISYAVTHDTPSGIRRIEGKYNPQILSQAVQPTDIEVKNLTGKKDIQSTSQKFTVNVIYTPEFDHLMRLYCPNYGSEPSRNGFSNLFFTLLPTLLFIAFLYFLMRRRMGGDIPNFGKSRARRMDQSQNPITFKDVAGCKEAKEDMQEIVEYLKDPERFSKLGAKIPRGVLLSGQPGTGKTLLAKAIAGEAKVPFYSISGSDFVEMFVGVGASRVRDMFEEGKKNAPCLIFIDEIDAVGRSRFSGIGGGHDEREQTLNALLVEMDGFETNQGVIVLAATNRPDVLDPALLRPGRFDRQITVDLPDLRGRLAILKIHAAKTILADDVDLRVVARGTPGFAGADLANLINEAALLAARRRHEAVTMTDLEEARDKVSWGAERKSHRLDDKVRRMTAFHEAGHALVHILCEHAMPLHKVTIIPRGNSLGSTMSLPENDEVTKSKRELLDYIAGCFGGRVAESIFFDDISTGASMDIAQATSIAKKMVCQWGMSEGLGLISYAGREEHIYLGRDITKSEDFSPETAREIDLEIRHIIDSQSKRVIAMLTENKAKLEKLATTLLEKETLTAAEVYALLEIPMPESTRSQEDLAHDFDDENGTLYDDLRTASQDAEATAESTEEGGKDSESASADAAGTKPADDTSDSAASADSASNDAQK